MGARPETPEALAGRFLRAIDAIRPLHQLLDTWDWGDMTEVLETDGNGGSYPLAAIRTNMARARAADANFESLHDTYLFVLALDFLVKQVR